MIVDFLRHGETGRAGFLDGRTDFPPSAEGWAQFRRQTDGRRWPRIITSHMRRANDCAVALAVKTGAALKVDPDWAELDFGLWDGLTRSDIEARAEWSAAHAAFHADPVAHPPPGGETWPVFSSRVVGALHRVAASADEGPFLVVAHGGSIRAALAAACGFEQTALWALRIGHGTLVRVELGTDAGGRLWGEIVEIRQP